jgi:hypothetical protein
MGLVGDDNREQLTLMSLCRNVLDLIPADGASVTLMSDQRDQGLAGAFGELAAELQDLEFTLGEGPGVDAFAHGTPVVVLDLSTATARWPQFALMAAELGLDSVCAFPLGVGAIRFGVLILYGDQACPISPQDLDDALVVRDLVTEIVIAMQSEAGSETVAWALDVSDHRAVVHQATGMISVQLQCDVQEALVRLRGRAFASGQPIDELAVAVVEGRATFDGS